MPPHPLGYPNHCCLGSSHPKLGVPGEGSTHRAGAQGCSAGSGGRGWGTGHTTHTAPPPSRLVEGPEGIEHAEGVVTGPGPP